MPKPDLGQSGVSQAQVPDYIERIWVCPKCGSVHYDGDATAEACFCIGKRGSGHDEEMVAFAHECLLSEAKTFLTSIASAQSQGTREQTDWMIAQAREGLRRAGGHDFDA